MNDIRCLGCLMCGKRSVTGRILFVGLLTVLFLGIGCGDDDSGSTKSGSQDNQIENSLVFTREDESIVTCGTDYAICCGIWEPGYIDKNTLKIMFADPQWELAAWKLFILVDEVTSGTTYTLPTPEAGEGPVCMFVADVPTQNELCSVTEESSGTIKINSFSCGPPVVVDVTITATIGSEYGSSAPSVQVAGNFSCTVYSNPAPFGCDFSF